MLTFRRLDVVFHIEKTKPFGLIVDAIENRTAAPSFTLNR
jgi:hypothetical protein